jgi:hypothetical protein
MQGEERIETPSANPGRKCFPYRGHAFEISADPTDAWRRRRDYQVLVGHGPPSFDRSVLHVCEALQRLQRRLAVAWHPARFRRSLIGFPAVRRGFGYDGQIRDHTGFQSRLDLNNRQPECQRQAHRAVSLLLDIDCDRAAPDLGEGRAPDATPRSRCFGSMPRDRRSERPPGRQPNAAGRANSFGQSGSDRHSFRRGRRR